MTTPLTTTTTTTADEHPPQMTTHSSHHRALAHVPPSRVRSVARRLTSYLDPLCSGLVPQLPDLRASLGEAPGRPESGPQIWRQAITSGGARRATNGRETCSGTVKHKRPEWTDGGVRSGRKAEAVAYAPKDERRQHDANTSNVRENVRAATVDRRAGGRPGLRDVRDRLHQPSSQRRRVDASRPLRNHGLVAVRVRVLLWRR